MGKKRQAFNNREQFEASLRMSKAEQTGQPYNKVRLTKEEKSLYNKDTRFYQPSSKIFTKTTNTGIITEDTNKRPVIESKVRTYRIETNTRQKKYIIYELDRKQKKNRLKTVPINKKYNTSTKVITAINKEDIKLSTKNVTILGSERVKTKLIQTNYLAKFKGTFTQVVAVVKVSDIRREITDYFVGYSKSRPILQAKTPVTKARLNKALMDCEAMAIGKFISEYGTAKKSGDLVTQIVQVRYQYYKRA